LGLYGKGYGGKKVEFLETAVSLATRVGERLRAVTFGEENLGINKKGERDLVTEFDLWSEKVISEELSARYPEHQILGEESIKYRPISELLKADWCWIVDPIDGTTNFASRIPHYGVSIALARRGEVICGVVYEPCKGELFMAEKGAGAFLNGKSISVIARDKLVDAVVATGFPYNRAELWPKLQLPFNQIALKCRDIRRLGAASLDICYVACGRLNLYYEYTLSPWDIAAGHLIVTEAGGYSQDVDKPFGTPLSMPTFGYACGSGESFKELLGIVQEVNPAE
jgi:myo-inositol-1(or 4)-monophosphatase